MEVSKRGGQQADRLAPPIEHDDDRWDHGEVLTLVPHRSGSNTLRLSKANGIDFIFVESRPGSVPEMLVAKQVANDIDSAVQIQREIGELFTGKVGISTERTLRGGEKVTICHYHGTIMIIPTPLPT